MDLQESIVGDLCGSLWTNEKHVNYLNWMEDSFVRTMLENDGRCYRKSITTDDVNDLLAPLDRYLPDSSDSTRDLKHQKNTTSKIRCTATEKTSVKKKKKMKKTCRSSQPQDVASKDQVVPQLANVTCDGHDMESDTVEVAVAAAAAKEQQINHHCNDEGRIKNTVLEEISVMDGGLLVNYC